MDFTFNHYNYNVLDLQKSIEFYEKALGLKEVRRKEAKDGSYILVRIFWDTDRTRCRREWKSIRL